MELTDRQRQVLNAIEASVLARGYPPTVRELADTLGLKAVSSVHNHLKALVRLGAITVEPGKPRAIRINWENVYALENPIT